MSFRLPREGEFLREVLRDPPVAVADLAVRTQGGWFDWDSLERIVFRSRVVPVVALRLSSEEALRDLFPGTLVRSIEEEGEKTAARNLFKEQELAGLVTAFEAEGIPVIVLKGLPFGERFYGNSVLREVRDIDLLVPPEFMDRAERALCDLGYALFEGIHSRAYYRRHHFHLVYVRRGLGIDVVELHWNLLPHPWNLNVDVGSLFRGSRAYDYRGSRIRVLSPVDEAAHLSASLRMGLFVSIKRLLDVEKILRAVRNEVAAEEIVARGEEWGIGEEVRTALFFADRFWGEGGTGIRFPSRIGRFASRIRGSDFFGLEPGREVRLRIWWGYCFARRSRLSFLARLLWRDETLRASIFFEEASCPSARSRVRRFLAAIVWILDLLAHRTLSVFRRRP
ncbi:MAG: nucleotidyltransferase family protein [Candidatus Eisenbacteria bacterium]|nr:nucleotidyltransferase family protein [Candidatus Eisenbacteria bacterium]